MRLPWRKRPIAERLTVNITSIPLDEDNGLGIKVGIQIDDEPTTLHAWAYNNGQCTLIRKWKARHTQLQYGVIISDTAIKRKVSVTADPLVEGTLPQRVEE